MEEDKLRKTIRERSPSDRPPAERNVPGWVRQDGAWSGAYVTPPSPDTPPPMPAPAPGNRRGCLAASVTVMRNLLLPLLALALIAGAALWWEHRANPDSSVAGRLAGRVVPKPPGDEAKGAPLQDSLPDPSPASGGNGPAKPPPPKTPRPPQSPAPAQPFPFSGPTTIQVPTGERTKDGAALTRPQKAIVLTLPARVGITVENRRIAGGDKAYNERMPVTRKAIADKYGNAIPVKASHPKHRGYLDVD